MDGKNRWTALLVVVVLLLTMCRCCLAGFAEVPSSVTINMSEDQNVLFHCRHERPDAIIYWLINGTPSHQYSDVSVSSIGESDGTFVFTLTIPTIPVYNGTEVVCGATFIDGSPSETTSPVTLIITVPPTTTEVHVHVTTASPTTTELTTAPPTTTISLPTTAAPPTATKPTTNPPAPFKITPSPLTVAVEQEMAAFECQHLTSDGITWLVNGISDNKINLPNITTSSSGTIRLLSVGTLLEYSGTTVECVALFLDGTPPLQTLPVTLMIQDTPGKVKNAAWERNSFSSLLTTRWSPLPSLDLNDTDPDIVYSVELYKITCGRNSLMNQTEMSVNSTNNNVDPMQIYKVIITARNNVTKGRNGARVEMSEEFMSLNKAKILQLTRNSQFNIRDKAPVPSYYTMILKPLDGHQEQNLMINISVQRSGEMVNMSVDGEIPTKTLWNASLLAYGCQSDTVVKGEELSTHDIQNISVTSPQPGEVRVTGDFIDGSTATGLLIIIYSLTNDSNVHYITGGSNSGLAGGEYKTSVFVVEENGLPFERVATSPKLVAVNSHEHEGLEVDEHSSSIEYSLQNTSTGVCITCTFLDSSATDCVAVVHQRISQLNSSGLMNIESSHKLTRSGDTASGCIEGVNMEDYQVGVFGWRQAPSIQDKKGSGATSSCQGCIVGTVLGVLVFILLAVVAVVVSLIVVRMRKRTKLPLHVHGEDTVRSGPPIPPFSDYVNHTEGQSLQSPPPVPPITEDREVLLEGSSESSPTQGSPHIAVSIDLPPPADPTYAEPQLPAVNQHQSKEKQEVSRIPSGESCGPTYAQPVLSSGVTSPPPATEPVVYDDINGFKNFKGQHYAMLGDLFTSKKVCIPDDSDQEKTVYSEIQPGSLVPTTTAVSVEPDTSSETNTANAETHTDCPFTVEHIFPRLLSMASKWLALGEALSLDEDRLDEISTNNETEEACLNVMLEFYMKRSDLKHSWEEIREAMRKVEEQDGKTEELGPTVQRSSEKSFFPGTTDEIHDKQEQTSEEVDVIKQTNKQAGDEDVNAYDVQTVSRCDGQEKIKIKETSHDEDDDNDIFASAQHVPCEEENVDDHVQYKPCIYSHSQDNIDSNGVKIHTEDPKRTNMDEVLPQNDSALEFPLQLFHGIEENQVVEHHQPAVCQAQPYDLDHLCEEQSSEHGYIDASVLPKHVDTSLEHLSQPYFDHNDQNEECYCQESEVDKTDYETALRKQLNIGGAPTPREREEPECGDLPNLCQASKKSTCSNLGKLSTQKKARDSAPSNLSCLNKQATAIQHICTKKQMNGKNKFRDILHNDHDGTCNFIVPVHKQMHNQEGTQCESFLLNLCCEDFRYSFSHLIHCSSSVG